MKKMMIMLFLLGTLFMQTNFLFAQGEAAVPFLLISPGARNGGMGEGGVALVNDATAIFWNPAGLAFQYDDPETQKRGQVSFMHSKWLPQFNFSDLFYDYMAGRFDLGEFGVVGASITYLNLGKNVWTDENGVTLGTFDSFEYSFSVAYATKLQQNLSVGLNAKLVQSNLSNVNPGTEDRDGRATTAAIDIGVLWTPGYEFLNDKLALGLNLSNLGPKVTYIDRDQADPMPTNLRMGLAVDAYNDGFNKILVIYDLNRLLVYKYADGTSDNVLKSVFYSSWVKGTARERINRFTQSFGLEYSYGALIALRAGYFYEDPNFGARKFMTFGAGLGVSIFEFDFSYISASENHPLSDTMRFSLGVRF